MARKIEIDPALISRLEYTQRSQMVKAIMVLSGMIKGMPTDRPLNDAELDTCFTYVESVRKLFRAKKQEHVLEEIKTTISGTSMTVYQQGHLLTCLAGADQEYYDSITRNLQSLHGLLKFASADLQYQDHEIEELQHWVHENAELAGTWPYDDISGLINDLHAGAMDESAKTLLRYAKCFDGPALTKSTPIDVQSGEALFTTSPRPIIPGHIVCVTGGSPYMTRNAIARLLESVGAKWIRQPTAEVNLLLVCGKGNQAWAHVSYGRKLEFIIEHRKRGDSIDVVDEDTFWPLMRRAGAAVPAECP